MSVILEFRNPDAIPIDVSSLLPSKILPLSVEEIQRLDIAIAAEKVLLGEVSQVTCSSDGRNDLVFSGDTQACALIGYGMSAGRLVVQGEAGEAAGSEMQGGELVIFGSAGDRLGNHMRRGLIWVDGNTGEYCGERLLAGTIFCTGKLGRYGGLGMKRGSLVTEELDEVLPGFFPAGIADEEWLRIYYKELEASGIRVPTKWKTGKPHRFTGDHLESGKGELLIYARFE